MRRPRILVADDSCTVRTVVRRTLSADGFDVVLACDGSEAVDHVRSRRPDLIILDIQMPVMDGYTACEKILEMSGRGSQLPVVFLTKEDAGHLSMLGTALGGYLPKPVRPDVLLSTVKDLLDRRTAVTVGAGREAVAR